MSAESKWDEVIRQYCAAPAEGMNRYWMSLFTWLEDFPDDLPYVYWQSGSGMRYRPRPSVADDPELNALDFDKLPFDEESDLIDRAFVSDASIVMLVDAASETEAWNIVREHFPDLEERFIDEKPDTTLHTLAKGGRFTVRGLPPEGEEISTAVVRA